MTLVMALTASTVRRAGADMRLLRAAVFTAVCVSLSAAAHAIVAGHAVGFRPLLAGFLAVFAVAAPLAGRERSLPGIAAGLAVGQLALHALFNAGEICAEPVTSRGAGLMALAGRLLCNDHGVRLTPEAAEQVVRNAGMDPSRLSQLSDAAATATGSGMSGMAGASGASGESVTSVTSGTSGTGLHRAAEMMASYSLSMVLGHLLAALLTGWLLRGGEAALWRLARLSTRTLRHAFALVRVLTAGTAGEPVSRPAQGRFAQDRRRPRTVLLRHSMARRGPPVLALAA